MSWQKCPLCNGSGIDPTVLLCNRIPICAVCKGQKIISELTGLPPLEQMSYPITGIYKSDTTNNT